MIRINELKICLEICNLRNLCLFGRLPDDNLPPPVTFHRSPVTRWRTFNRLGELYDSYSYLQKSERTHQCAPRPDCRCTLLAHYKSGHITRSPFTGIQRGSKRVKGFFQNFLCAHQTKCHFLAKSLDVGHLGP